MTARAGRGPVGQTGSFDYDAELRRHNLRLRAAAAVEPHERVLDIGCGTGQTTREAARAAAAGSALGVDISEQALQRAWALSADEGLPNVSFQRADAQVHRFRRAHFDVCISRFGTMFFADPLAAFTNIGLALRPGARLVLLVWQAAERNEWSSVIRQALTAGTTAPAGPANGPNPFSLADPAVTERILTAAGFTGITVTDVHEPVWYGPDSATAYEAVLRLYEPHTLLAAADPATAEQARRRLRAAVAAHDTDTGVYFDSRAWLITANRRAD
jgi:hypothetical protein